MPVKRRLHKGREHRITADAIEAFRAGDHGALHRALGLRPWQPSPLPLAVNPLGVDPAQPPAADDGSIWAQAWQLAVELQGELQRCR